MVYISEKQINLIIKQARAELPNECCGMLAGNTCDSNIEIVEIFPMINVDKSPQHFSLDPQEQFTVLYKAREKGLKIIGNYHSHPTDPARPSREDIRLAYDPSALYMILSLLEPDKPVLKAFKIINETVTEIPLEIK